MELRPQGLPRSRRWSRHYVRAPEQRWDTAMRDDDGGLSLISAGIRAVTTAEDKQNQLQKRDPRGPEPPAAALPAAGSSIPTPTSTARSASPRPEESSSGLTADENAVYYRVHALQESLCVARRRRDGSWPTAGRSQASATATRCPRQLTRLPARVGHAWRCPSAGRSTCSVARGRRPRGSTPGTLNTFTRYLRDYLLDRRRCSTSWSAGSAPVVNLKTRDEAARRTRPAQVRADHPQRLRDEPRPEHDAHAGRGAGRRREERGR